MSKLRDLMAHSSLGGTFMKEYVWDAEVAS